MLARTSNVRRHPPPGTRGILSLRQLQGWSRKGYFVVVKFDAIMTRICIFCVLHCSSRNFLFGTSLTTLLAGFGARLQILPKQTFAFAGFSGTVRTEALSSPGMKILSFSCSSFLRISLSVSNTFFAWPFSTFAPAAKREIIVDISTRCLSQNITPAIGAPYWELRYSSSACISSSMSGSCTHKGSLREGWKIPRNRAFTVMECSL